LKLSRHLSFVACLAAALVVLLPLSAAGGPKKKNVKEVSLSADELKRLDTFEGHTLAKADQAFNKDQYRQARAEYDSFILEFPRSKLIPYALLRKGRCAELDDKRFKAIADYKEILDYFPNNVKYAAAALFHLGDCHWDNGDIDKALKAWIELAEDKEYRKEPLGAFAINHLADHLIKHEKPEKRAEAVKYYHQVAVDFRKANPDASNHARGPVIQHYVRTSPNEQEFRRFYTEMRTLEQHPQTVPPDLTVNTRYWDVLRAYIRHHGHFEEADTEQRKRYYAYWSGQMSGKFNEPGEYNDSFHIERAAFLLLSNDSRAGWVQALDQQYNRHQQAGNWQRTVRWMRLYKGMPEKVEQYFRKVDPAKVPNKARVELMMAVWETEKTKPLARKLMDKLAFGEMTNAELGSLALHFYEKDQVLSARFISKIDFKKMTASQTGGLARSFWDRDHAIAKMVLGKIRYAETEDKELAGVARMFWHGGGEVVKDVCLRIRDKAYGKSELLSYYHSRWGWNPREGLPLADALIKVDKYATAAWWAKAEFHHSLKEYAKAISAFQNCQNEPENLKRIVQCQWSLKKLDATISQLREIENFFPSIAPWAAISIADYYEKAKDEKRCVKALRDVLKKYPDSGQSKQAHERLEAKGYKMGGGVDAD